MLAYLLVEGCEYCLSVHEGSQLQPHQRRQRRTRALPKRIIRALEPVGGPDRGTAHLDRANGAIVLQLLKRAAAELGATVIVSSHDPDALEAADEVLPLELTANAGPAGT